MEQIWSLTPQNYEGTRPLNSTLWVVKLYPRVVRQAYKGTSLMRKRPTLGPYIRPMARAVWWS